MKKIKKKILIIIGILIIMTSGVIFVSNKGKEIEVETYIAKKGDIAKYVEEIGTIKSKSQRKIYSKSMGEVENINVEVGDTVKAGDILLVMDSEELELQIKSLEAQMEGIKASYKEAVKPVDKKRIDQAQANVNTIKMNLEEAKRQAENNKKLYEEGAISFDIYKASLNNVTVQENALKIAKNELDLLKKGVSGNIKNQYEAQLAELAYQLKILQKKKDELVIKAPIDGMIMEVFVKEGVVLQPGMEIIEIGRKEDMYIEVDILASEIGKINEGNSVIISSEDLGIEMLKGKVDKIYPKAFSKVSDLGIQQKRVRVEIGLVENIENLRLGYEIDVNIFEVGAKDVIIIPESSVFELEDNKYVFVVQDGAAVLRKIETRIESDDMIEVISGLKEGEKVIVSPDKDLEEGTKVKEI